MKSLFLFIQAFLIRKPGCSLFILKLFLGYSGSTTYKIFVFRYFLEVQGANELNVQGWLSYTLQLTRFDSQEIMKFCCQSMGDEFKWKHLLVSDDQVNIFSVMGPPQHLSSSFVVLSLCFVCVKLDNVKQLSSNERCELLWNMLYFHLVLKFSWVTAYCRSK